MNIDRFSHENQYIYEQDNVECVTLNENNDNEMVLNV